MKYMSLQCRRIISKCLLLQDTANHSFTKNVFVHSMTSRNYVAEATTVQENVLSEEYSDEVHASQKRKVNCPENARMMKVAILGVPNAGKSTIINALTNYDVCPVSRRPHTTRKNQKAVYLDDNTQLVFVDTPGLVNVKEIKKFAFTPEFVYGPERSIGTSHVIAVIHDVGSKITREKLDFRIKHVLEKFPDKKSILILNKIDLVKTKSTLLETVKYLTCGIVGGKPLPVRTFQEKKQSHIPIDMEVALGRAKKRYEQTQELEKATTKEDEATIIANKLFAKGEIKRGIHQLGWPKFHDVFMVSGLAGDGIELLRKYMIVNAVPEGWLYDSDTLTDVPPKKLVISILKAKLLDHLPQEMPFVVEPVLEYWQEDVEGLLAISIQIRCPKERYQYAILGTGGSLINKIIEETQKSVSGLLHRPVKLTLTPVYDKTMAKKL